MCALLGSIFATTAVHALPVGEVPYIDNWSYYYLGGIVKKSPNAESACKDIVAMLNGITPAVYEYAYTGVSLSPQMGYLVYGWCQMNQRNLLAYPQPQPWQPHNSYYAAWNSLSCPTNSSTLTMSGYPNSGCTCNAGYNPDAMGTACVAIPPIAQNTCPISGLTPLTDPVAIDFDNNVGSRWRPDKLTAVFQGHLSCLENAIVARGGSYTGTSAYRPFEYQRHLFEIVQKDMDLKPSYMLAHPECQALRDEITHEMGTQSGPPPGHGLQYGQDVATPGKSRHERGEAFDLTPSRLTDVQLAPLYPLCGVVHIALPKEPWHVQ